MSVDQLLEEVEKLTPGEREEFISKLNATSEPPVAEATPELIAAIDEGLRSLREEGSIPLEQFIQEVKTWRIESP
jgi:hypothetical protein